MIIGWLEMRKFWNKLTSLRKKEELKRLLRGAVLKNCATLGWGAVFSLIIMFRKEIAPHSKEALFSKTAPQRSRFSKKGRKQLLFVQRGTILVPQRHRFGSSWGTVLPPKKVENSSSWKKEEPFLKQLPFSFSGTILVPLWHCFCKTAPFCKVALF